MSELDNAVLVRGLYASGFAPDRLEEFLAPECVYHGPEGAVEGIDALREMCRELHRAFPDLRFSVEALRVDGDEVEVQWSLRGTHEGPFRGVEPTGRTVEMTGRHVEVVRGGRIVERFGGPEGEAGLVERLAAAGDEREGSGGEEGA